MKYPSLFKLQLGDHELSLKYTQRHFTEDFLGKHYLDLFVHDRNLAIPLVKVVKMHLDDSLEEVIF